MPDLNEQVRMVVEDATVITVNIDDTLTVSGDAADAKAVGDALALKADKSELQNSIDVNGQGADAQGHIIVTAADTQMSDTDTTTVKAAVEAAAARTAADIPMSSAPGADTIAEAISGSAARTADGIAMSESDPTTVKSAIDAATGNITTLQSQVIGLGNRTAADFRYATGSAETIKEHVDAIDQGLVKSVYGTPADANGDVSPASVPYADNLTSDQMEEVQGAFELRTTGGHLGITGSRAWILRLMGERTHTGYVKEQLSLFVSAATRPVPPAITAALDKAVFIAYAQTAGTYTLEYDEDSWSESPALYGVTISNDPVNGDEIVIVWDGENDPVMTVNAAERHAPPEITATINRDTFVSYVDTSGTYTLTYTTGWSEDPDLYGLTIANEPVNGDLIVIVYVKEVRGTITQSDPDALVATGWNLYNPVSGYARVVRYSDGQGYRIGGDYTAVAYAPSIGGTETPILPDADGEFSVPGDGYVIVTGGSAESTWIVTEWSDWGPGHEVTWESYAESGVDVSSIMATYFPNGLCRAGEVRDEIDLGGQVVYNRIQRMAYSAANLAAAAATGRSYEYDENYIYLERAEPVTSAITVEAEYACHDHGMEWFTGGDVGPYAVILYGQNLKDKLRRDVITWNMTVAQVKGMGS